MTPGTVYWFTGLAGAGKSTLARLFVARLRAGGRTTVLLDGDTLREVFGGDLGYSRADRFASAMRNARLCKLISEQGVDVVCATISLFHECQSWNRAHILRYREILVEAPIDVLAARHPARLYGGKDRLAACDVVGVDVPAELPLSPEVSVVNDGLRPAVAVAEEVWSALGLDRRTDGTS